MKCSINGKILCVLLFCSSFAAGVGWRGAAKGPYPTKMKDVALKKEDMPKIVAGHPRLYMRAKPWKYGPSLQELVERAKKNKYYHMGLPKDDFLLSIFITGDALPCRPAFMPIRSISASIHATGMPAQ